MANHDAPLPRTRKGEDTDGTLFNGPFVSWDEITRAEIAAFESALDEARDEYDMQRFLEANPRILIQHLVGGRSAWIIPKKRLGAEHETDFMIAQKASGGLVWYAVELERPQARIFNKNGDPSAALTHALRQINDWRDWLSQNRDYAARPRERSGLGLISIDPELEGLIVIGRDAELDQCATASRRRRLERTHRIKIETYDWLLSQASERLDGLDKRARDMAAAAEKPNAITELLSTLFNNPPPEKPAASKAVREVFGETRPGWANTSVVRGEIEWEGVQIWPDPDFDSNALAPLQIVYAQGMSVDRFLHPGDWTEWIDYVTRNLDAQQSLLVTEIAPAENLQEILTMERDGTWYAYEWSNWRGETQLSRLDILVCLPPAASYDQKKSRLAVAREVFQRYIPDPAVTREKELERKRKAEFKVISLALAPGDTVIHDIFGHGTVISMSDSGADTEAVIDFGAELGVKRLILGYAPLKKL
jgi:hypothetical protein